MAQPRAGPDVAADRLDRDGARQRRLAATPPGSLAAAAQRAAPAVVSIAASKAPQGNPHADDPWFRFFFGQRGAPQGMEPQRGLGSGVIVSAEGYLITNHHVVEGADEIEVLLADGRQAQAKVVGTDPETDVALLKINLDKLPAVTFGNSARLQVGDAVLAIGNPFGVGQTVTSGIVSALDRTRPGTQHLRELHPDRRCHQPRQLGRRAGRWQRQPGRHQHGDLLAHAAAAWASASRFPRRRRAR